MTNASSGPAQNADVGSETSSSSNQSVNPFGNQSQPNQPSFYDLLGLRPTASVQDIRRAYRDLSKLYHPDTTELESAIATRKFQLLNEAYATLSSPEKRLTYDYKIGFSRISVMQPLKTANGATAEARANQTQYSKNAYLDPTDRPLSAGEFFALFILGITFVCCLVLVVTLSLTRGNIDAVVSDLHTLATPQPTPTEQIISQPTSRPAGSSTHSSTTRSTANSATSSTTSSATPSQLGNPELRPELTPELRPELPQLPWLVPKAQPSQPASLPLANPPSVDTLLQKMAPSLKPNPQANSDASLTPSPKSDISTQLP